MHVFMYLILMLLGSTTASFAADMYLNLGLGATFFQRTTQNGTWFQEGYPYHMQMRDLAGKIGVGFRTSPEWAFETNVVSLGQAKSAGLSVPDDAYDPINKRALPGTPKSRENVFDARERVVAMEFVARRSFDVGPIKPFLGLGGFLGVHDMPYTIYNPSSGALAHGQYAGYIIGAVGGGGICYQWVCGETFYYRGFGTQGYPISKSWIVPMLTAKVEF